MAKERDYLWDNVKAVLIFLVVLGHCLELCSKPLLTAVNIDKLIYCFHMPAFIFVSGFWAKRCCVDGKLRADKVFMIFAYYLIFQIIFSIITVIMAPETAVSLFNPNRGLWYLLALFYYYLLVPLAEKLPPWLVIGLTVIFSLLIGADKKVPDNYLAIQRAVTFAPFFFTGYYLKAERIAKLRTLNFAVRLLITVVFTGVVVAALRIKRDAFTMHLFYAKSNYAQMHHTLTQGLVLRAMALVFAACLTLALILILPSKKTFFSTAGKNSLQIFILHMAVVCVLVRLKGFKPVIDSYPDLALVVVIALAATALLSLNVFGYPFKWIQAGVKKIIKP